MENVQASYEQTLEFAVRKGDFSIRNELVYRIELLNVLSEISFDLNKFTRRNSHGDYLVSNIICGKNKINAVIDWTNACVHPVCWEVIRSYTYSEPTCKKGKIDIERLKKYVGEYLKVYKLSEYDLVMMPYLFFIILVYVIIIMNTIVLQQKVAIYYFIKHNIQLYY